MRQARWFKKNHDRIIEKRKRGEERILARESFLLRTDPKILAALRRWAEDDLRSVNGQLDFLLRTALRDAGRLNTTEKPTEKPEGKSR